MKRFLLIMLACVGCINAFALKYSTFKSSNFVIKKGLNNEASTTKGNDVLCIDGEGGDIKQDNWSSDKEFKFEQLINQCKANGDNITTLAIVNVRDIYAQAFTNDHTSTQNIKSIRLYNIKGTIYTAAFQHLVNVSDVYLEQDGIVECQCGAFDPEITCGQGNVTHPIATLHITSNNAKTYATYYSLNLTDGQVNRTYLMSHGNGWQNFVSDDFDAKKEASKSHPYVGTYCAPYPSLIPYEDVRGVYAVLPFSGDVPKLLSLTKGWSHDIIGLPKFRKLFSDGKDETTKLDVVNYRDVYYFYLPANISVLIYSVKDFHVYNANNAQISYYSGSLTWSKKSFKNSTVSENLLRPLYEKSEIGPSEFDEKGNIIYRNFFLSLASKTKNSHKWCYDDNPYKSQKVVQGINNFFKNLAWENFEKIFNNGGYVDYWAFFRSSPTKTKYLTKAYLKVPKSICNSDVSRYMVDTDVVPSVILNFDDVELVEDDDDNNNAKSLNLFFGLGEIDDEDYSEITGIKDIQYKSIISDDTYYNLNGVKTKNPGKGIYIHNGKKVVIK